MLVSDSVFEKIGKYYKLNDDELDTFVEEIRSKQIEIFYKTFLMYYEDNKSELEIMYLDSLSKKHDVKDTYEKFHRLITNELDNNIEARQIVMKSVHGYIMNLIYGFLKRCDDDEIVESVLKEFFFYIDPVAAGIKAGDIPAETFKIT